MQLNRNGQGVKFLAAHPEIQIKLRRHIQSATGGAGAADDEASSAQLGMDDLTPEKTPYLEAVVHEVLRLGRVSIGYARTGESRGAVNLKISQPPL